MTQRSQNNGRYGKSTALLMTASPDGSLLPVHTALQIMVYSEDGAGKQMRPDSDCYQKAQKRHFKKSFLLRLQSLFTDCVNRLFTEKRKQYQGLKEFVNDVNRFFLKK